MQRRSKWVHCSSSQRAWIEALQHVHFAAYGASSSGAAPHPDTMSFRPPHPSLPRFSSIANHIAGAATPVLPTPEPHSYYLRPVFFWLPDLYFAAAVPHMPCSHLGCALPTMRMGWPATGPLYIHDLQGGQYLHYSMHHCRKHGSFASIHPISISKLPAYVRDAFPFVMMDGTGVTKSLMELIARAPMLHLSFVDLETSLNHLRYTTYYEAMLQYLQQCAHYSQYGRAPQGWAPAQFSASMSDQNGYNERPAPSAEWLERIYISYTTNLLPFYERRLRVTHDPSFTVSRNMKAISRVIRDDDDPANPSPIRPWSHITALLGNTTGQLLAFRFISAGKEGEEQLLIEGIQKRFQMLGKEGREEPVQVNPDGSVTITSTSSSTQPATTPTTDAVALHSSFDHMGVLFPQPCDTSMAHAVSMQWSYEWNVDRNIKLQRQQDYGTVNHWLLDHINQVAERVHGTSLFPDIKFPDIGNEEFFGVTEISTHTKSLVMAASAPDLFESDDDNGEDVDAAQIIGAAGAFDAEALSMINQIIELVAKDIQILPGEQPHPMIEPNHLKRKALDDGSTRASKRFRDSEGNSLNVPWNSSEFAIMITMATNASTQHLFTNHLYDTAARAWNAVIQQMRNHQPIATKEIQEGIPPNPIAARFFQVLQLRDKNAQQIGYAYRKICDIVYKGNTNHNQPTVTSTIATSFASALPTAAVAPIVELPNPTITEDINEGEDDDEEDEAFDHTLSTNPYLQTGVSSTSSTQAPIAYDVKSSIGLKFSDDEEILYQQLLERCRDKKDRFKEMTLMWRAEYYASYAALAQAQANGQTNAKRRDILPRSRQQIKSKHESNRRKDERHARSSDINPTAPNVLLPVVSPQLFQQQQDTEMDTGDGDYNTRRRNQRKRGEAVTVPMPMGSTPSAAAAAAAAAANMTTHLINPHPLLPDELEPRTGPVDVPSNRPAKHWTEIEAQYFLQAIRDNPSKHGNANLSVILTQWNYDRVHHPEKGLGPVSYRQLKAKVQQLKRAKRTVGLNIIGHSDKHRVQQQQQMSLQLAHQQQQLMAQQQYQAQLIQQHALAAAAAAGGQPGAVPVSVPVQLPPGTAVPPGALIQVAGDPSQPQFVHGNTQYIIVATGPPGAQPLPPMAGQPQVLDASGQVAAPLVVVPGPVSVPVPVSVSVPVAVQPAPPAAEPSATPGAPVAPAAAAEKS